MTCCAVCREPIVFEGGKWVRLARGEHIADPRGDVHHRHAPEQVGPFAELSPPYSTIVADPPWAYDEGWPKSNGAGQKGNRGRAPLPYSSMPLEAISGMPVGSLAAPDAHLYLWTTNRYLRDAYTVADC